MNAHILKVLAWISQNHLLQKLPLGLVGCHERCTRMRGPLAAKRVHALPADEIAKMLERNVIVRGGRAVAKIRRSVQQQA